MYWEIWGKYWLQLYECLHSTHGKVYIFGKVGVFSFQKDIVCHTYYENIDQAVTIISPISPTSPSTFVTFLQIQNNTTCSTLTDQTSNMIITYTPIICIMCYSFLLGFHPVWNKTFEYDILCPDLAIVEFQVMDYESITSNQLVAQSCMPFNSLQQGRVFRVDKILLKNT